VIRTLACMTLFLLAELTALSVAMPWMLAQ
jgi:hypothetical protein